MKITLTALCCAVLVACGGVPIPQPIVMVGAGDIAGCATSGDEATAKLIEDVIKQYPEASVFTLGDNVYQNATAQEFSDCYTPNWGSFKTRTYPVAGNHDYLTANATGYFGYYGTKAGDPSKGYYSYDLGAWHIVVVNSNCAAIGGCQAGSNQVKWLRDDLTANKSQCEILMWHHARFSSGADHGNNNFMQDIWKAASDNQVDLVLTAHDHTYERFAAMNADGLADVNGITEFVVGSGGFSHDALGVQKPNSMIFNADTYGVLQLELFASSYNFKFLSEAGKSFTDSGSGVCH